MSQVQINLGNGKTAVTELDYFTRIMNGQFWDFEEVRYDRPLDYANAYAYVGVAPAGSSADAAVWCCVRRSYDLNGKCVRDQYRSDIAWTARTTGWY